MAKTHHTEQPALVEGVPVSRLHGEACITCGAAGPPLVPAGHVYTEGRDGGRLGWAVVACPRHREAR
ncbi:hypothetical protein ACIQGZ_12710 [Streptomyces sp. NPDC092296]|uniref:hypothetical protein n=1 Tax=Streptomyces sp. NPDC092296 TaxID=3366012 RepID=UPI003824F2EE